MVKYVKGDLTNATERYIAHGCNAQGVMGSGVALAIRNKWPKAYIDYVRYIKDGGTLGGSIVSVNDDKYIINLITQEFFGNDGKRYASPPAIMKSLVDTIWDYNISGTIAIPEIGCGLGGLNWNGDVLPVLERIETDFEVEFRVYKI